MSLFGLEYLSPLSSGDTMHDYQHAAKLFRSNGYANAPKYKYLFYVNFVLNSNVSTNADLTLISYLVKNIELPKFEAEVQELNQYNKKVLIQTKIKYTPISIKFHDDNANQVRLLWQNYYNYYFGDGVDLGGAPGITDDKYTTMVSNLWGMTGTSDPFFDYIEIYSMESGNAQKITIFNPLISHFGHDNHDYAEGTQLMENTMTLHYTAVQYEDGYAGGIPGFNDSAYYDQTPSSIDGGKEGQVIDDTGNLITPNDTWSNPDQNSTPTSSGATLSATTSFANALNPSLTSAQISMIASQIASSSTNSSYVFPTSTISNQAVLSTQSASPSTASYQTGTVQSTLYNKGYTPTQIQSATSFLANNNLPLTQSNAEDYIQGRTILPTTGSTSTTQSANPGYTPSSASFLSNVSTNLQSLGYSQSSINAALAQLSSIRIPSSANPTTIAQDFINNNSTPVINATSSTGTVPVSNG